MHVACGHGLVLSWRRCDTLSTSTSGYEDDITCSYREAIVHIKHDVISMKLARWQHQLDVRQLQRLVEFIWTRQRGQVCYIRLACIVVSGCLAGVCSDLPTVQLSGGHSDVIGWAGQLRNVTCIGRGQPLPTVQWLYRGGQQVTDNSAITVVTSRTNTAVTSHLQVCTMPRRHAAKIFCYV